MEYLLKASGMLFMLFLFHAIFLKNETFFKSIRGYFIIGLLIVLAVPLVEIPIYVEAVASQLNLNGFTEIASNTVTGQQAIDWTKLMVYTYLAGVVFFSLKFLTQLTSLGILLSKHKFVKSGIFYLVETSKNIAPFSFFNIIIYNKSQFSMEELDQIINHEKAHAKQWHSIDTILAHLLVISLWFNPFVWLYKKAVQQNLEFLADAYALERANNHKLYQFTILKTSSANYCTEITNNFYNSLIKKRIVMLQKNKSNNNSQWKYALLLPLLVAFVFTFNTKVIAQEKKLVKVEEIKANLLISSTTSDKELKKEATAFKKEFGITLTFKGVKRNTDNKITAIKIDAKGKGLKSKFENAGSTPIKPIKIAYDSKNNSLNISNLDKVHKSHYSYKIHKDGDKNLKRVEFKGKSKKDGNFVFITSDGEKIHKGDKQVKYEYKVVRKKGDKKGNKEKVWIHKNDKNNNVKVEVIELKEGEHVIEVIHEGDVELEETHEIEIIKEKEGENVFIIKTDGDQMKKHKITTKGDFVFISSDDESPLIIADGKEISKEKMEDIDPDKIEKIEVLKGESATKKYGDKGKNGVILITTKKE